MKRILIIGANSYIGTSFKKWIIQWPEQYEVDAISVRNDEWKQKSLKEYDTILHLAAIVHVKENDINKYYEVNRDLTLELAKKAKIEGVKQFIFLSTMGVYGIETGYITMETVPNPKTIYAKSKYEAEKLLSEIEDDEFKVTILRPPIVYGKGCGGNYMRLSKLALKVPIFPAIDNKRSMIFIDNLSEFIRLAVDNKLSGIYFPQNKEYVNTTVLVNTIAKEHNIDINITRFFNILVNLGIIMSGTFGKVFGSFKYDKEMPGGPNSGIYYETCTFEESIRNTEK